MTAMEFVKTNPFDLCKVVTAWADGVTRAFGQAYVYEVDALRAAAAKAYLHLDRWLTGVVARLFQEHGPKRPCALFFSVGAGYRGEFVRISVCERSGTTQADWMADIPGFFDLGEEALPSNASVWAVWDGTGFFRVHDFWDARPSGLMVVDIGGQSGITISMDLTDEQYDAVVRDPVDRWDYAPIPRNHVEPIDLGTGDAVLVRHLAFQSIPTALDDADEDDAWSAPGSPEVSAPAPEHQVATDELVSRIGSKATRASAIVEACERRVVGCIPAIASTIDALTWGEVEAVREALPNLAPEITPCLVQLLSSTRKQTAEIVTAALARIADPGTAEPLLHMMRVQAGTANAIRARDALIEVGEPAVPALTKGLGAEAWETRMYAAQALGSIGEPSVLPFLQSVARSDRSAKVRDAATEAIHMIEGPNDGQATEGG